jgi:hypothetical protein
MLPAPLDRAANAGEMRRALINLTYERKQFLRLTLKTKVWYFVRDFVRQDALRGSG